MANTYYDFARIIGDAKNINVQWETATDWDSAQSESGVIHESVSNTDQNDGGIVKQGYSPSNPYLQSNLYGYWPLHENSGGTAYDFSGNNNDGNVSGATQGSTGLLGTTGYYFDGSNDEILTTDFNLSGDFTVSAWVNFDSNQSDIHSIMGDANTGNGWFFQADNGNEFPEGILKFGFNDGTKNCGGTTDIRGDWHHVVGMTDSGTERVYVDAVEEGTNSNTSTVNAGTAAIGSLNGTGFAKGNIWDVRLYDKALAPSEISTIYNVVKSTGTITTGKKSI